LRGEKKEGMQTGFGRLGDLCDESVGGGRADLKPEKANGKARRDGLTAPSRKKKEKK